jgi:hypothetical protein
MTATVNKGRPRRNAAGMVFGPLTVLSPGEDVIYCGKRRITAMCRCVCGNVVKVRMDYLRHFKDKPGCWCNRKRGRPHSNHTKLMLAAILIGKSNSEMKELFNISHQYVSILRKRVALLGVSNDTTVERASPGNDEGGQQTAPL